eukprot:1168127_1
MHTTQMFDNINRFNIKFILLSIYPLSIFMFFDTMSLFIRLKYTAASTTSGKISEQKGSTVSKGADFIAQMFLHKAAKVPYSVPTKSSHIPFKSSNTPSNS